MFSTASDDNDDQGFGYFQIFVFVEIWIYFADRKIVFAIIFHKFSQNSFFCFIFLFSKESPGFSMFPGMGGGNVVSGMISNNLASKVGFDKKI